VILLDPLADAVELQAHDPLHRLRIERSKNGRCDGLASCGVRGLAFGTFRAACGVAAKRESHFRFWTIAESVFEISLKHRLAAVSSRLATGSRATVQISGEPRCRWPAHAASVAGTAPRCWRCPSNALATPLTMISAMPASATGSGSARQTTTPASSAQGAKL